MTWGVWSEVLSPLWTIITALVTVVLFSTVLLAVIKYLRYVSISPEKSTEVPCLGHSFKLGVLYDTRQHKLLEPLWKEEEFEQDTEIKETKAHYVFSDDSISTKLKHSHVQSNLALCFMNGSLDTSKSARNRYLCDHKLSARQARVVLCYRYTSKTKRIAKAKSTYFGTRRRPEVMKIKSATHVVVGVEYGAEAYFVFDKDVSESEDYENVAKQMNILVQMLPCIAEINDSLTDLENLIATQLKCTFYSDFPITKTPSTIEEVIEVYKTIQSNTNTALPITAFLYPLNCISKRAPDICTVEPHLVKNTVEMLEVLFQLKCKTKDLQQHPICNLFTGINTQLEDFQRSIEGCHENIKRHIKKNQHSHNNSNVLHTSALSSQLLWLNHKENEIKQLSYFLQQFDNHESISIFTRHQFDDFVSNGTTTCAIILEIKLGQKQDVDLNEVPWYDDTQLINCAESEIKQFIEFASNNKNATFIVTVFNKTDPSYQQGIVTSLYKAGTTGLNYNFEFPFSLCAPTYIESNWMSIKVGLPNNLEQSKHLLSLKVFFKPKNQDHWNEKAVPVDQNEVQITDLEPNREYLFKVAALYQYGQGPDSDISCFNTTIRPLAAEISQDVTQSEVERNTCTYQSERDSLKVMILKTRNVLRDSNKMITIEEFGTPSTPTKPMKVVMLLGETGVGKSTLINGIINHILGVKWDYDFRFKLICEDSLNSQAHSQTSFITAYTFHWQEGFAVPYSLTVIDTPGFGDTRGIYNDNNISRQLKELFSIEGNYTIDSINAVAFVARSTDIRLTLTQRYVFDSVFSILERGATKSIFIMSTFASNSDNLPVIEALKEANIPFATYYSFNNCAVYGKQTKLFKTFWDLGYQSYSSFLLKLQNGDCFKTSSIVHILQERERLDRLIHSIQTKIHEGLFQMNKLQTEKTEAKARSDQSNFSHTTFVSKVRMVDLPSGLQVNNCLTCRKTCSSTFKPHCITRNCIVCNCSWNQHQSQHQQFQYYQESVTYTNEDLKKQCIARDESIILKLKDGLNKMSQTLYADIKEARRCMEHLRQAIKCNLYEMQYIELLLEAEKYECKPGFQYRTELLLKRKAQVELMTKLSNKDIDNISEDSEKWWQIWI